MARRDRWARLPDRHPRLPDPRLSAGRGAGPEVLSLARDLGASPPLDRLIRTCAELGARYARLGALKPLERPRPAALCPSSALPPPVGVGVAVVEKLVLRRADGGRMRFDAPRHGSRQLSSLANRRLLSDCDACERVVRAGAFAGQYRPTCRGTNLPKRPNQIVPERNGRLTIAYVSERPNHPPPGRFGLLSRSLGRCGGT